MNNIHPTAIVSSKARLADNITISPYAIIEDDVEIGNDTFIGPYAVLYNGARIGNHVTIKQSASISHQPQDFGYKGEPTLFYVGDNTLIHEFVTLHRGTKLTGFSRVGKNCMLMAYSHIGHDCLVGDNVVLANAVQVGGACVLEDYVTIGGLTPVHQKCRVGAHSMTGGGFRITQDVPPFILAGTHPLKFSGLNVIGLRRRGFSNDDISVLKKAYSYLYDNSLNVSQAREKIQSELSANKYVKQMLEFLSGVKRGIIGK
ncbi:MAG: acyl-ACP--UDP-N-acetylglucosamine O-acyltransferase [Ignavibacteriales bacterium]|nr:MAG: acyl-ACP--UDP-N-acetylglucosamine O-acyltransferase [Ignavibacteriales bacterium]